MTKNSFGPLLCNQESVILENSKPHSNANQRVYTRRELYYTYTVCPLSFEPRFSKSRPVAPSSRNFGYSFLKPSPYYVPNFKLIGSYLALRDIHICMRMRTRHARPRRMRTNIKKLLVQHSLHARTSEYSAGYSLAA